MTLPDVSPVAGRGAAIPGAADRRRSAANHLGYARADANRTAAGVERAAERRLRDARLIAASYRATMRTVDPVTARPNVRMQDVRLTCGADGSCQGVSTFDLDPAGLQTVRLELPYRFELLQCRLGGMPALAIDEGRNQWRLTPAPKLSPQPH